MAARISLFSACNGRKTALSLSWLCTSSLLSCCVHNWILQLVSTQSLTNAAWVVKRSWENQLYLGSHLGGCGLINFTDIWRVWFCKVCMLSRDFHAQCFNEVLFMKYPVFCGWQGYIGFIPLLKSRLSYLLVFYMFLLCPCYLLTITQQNGWFPGTVHLSYSFLIIDR